MQREMAKKKKLIETRIVRFSGARGGPVVRGTDFGHWCG